MPATYYVDHAARLARFTVVGDLTAEEMVQAIRSAAAEIERPGYHILSDHREIGEPATRPQLDAVVETLQDLGRSFAHSRGAVVVSKPGSYGMMRVLMVLAERVPLTVRIFRDFETAEHWAITGEASLDALQHEGYLT